MDKVKTSLRLWQRVYPVGSLLIGGLAIYVLVSSLANAWMALDYRLNGGEWLGNGEQTDPLYELGTSLGFWGTIYFGLNFILATRWRWVEMLFGGLDKVYKAHNLAGRLALTMLTLHGGLLILQAIPDQALLTTYLVPGVDWGYTTGVAGLLLLIALVVVTIWVKLPYQTWLASHKWMGVPYALGGLHAILLQGDWYMIAITALGIYAWLYITLWYPARGPRVAGTLAEVNPKGSVTELVATLEEPVNARPGQFVFLAVQGAQERISPEVHPFSISSQIDERTLRISAKALGDYTRALRQAHPGDKVVFWGPYGDFGRTYQQGDGDLVWLAGGIGVTPFLAMLRNEQRLGPRAGRRIHFVWTVKTAEEAIYLEEIEDACAGLPQVEFHLHVTENQGLLTIDRVAAHIGEEQFDRTTFLICGPKAMMSALRSQLRGRGAPRYNIITEEFGMR